MLTVRFVRHAQSLVWAGIQPTTSDDLMPLSPLGSEQAKAFAQSVGEKPELIVHSPFVRTEQTSAPLRRKFPDVPSEVWPVHEFLCFDYKSFPQGIPFATWQAQHNHYWELLDPDYHQGASGESFRAFVARCRECLKRLEGLARQGRERVLVFLHGYFMTELPLLVKNPSREVDTEHMKAFLHADKVETVGILKSLQLRYDEGGWSLL